MDSRVHVAGPKWQQEIIKQWPVGQKMFHRLFIIGFQEELMIGQKGLTTNEVIALQTKYGKNEIIQHKKENIFRKAIHVISEPMFLLLLIAAIIYFILGEPRDGAIMLVFVIAIISIDVIQEWKTDKTLNALKDLSAPHITVIRDGAEQVIASYDLVPGDIVFIAEGVKIPADGKIMEANDLCINESTLTGEAEGVWKTVYDEHANNNEYWRKDYCYAGTLVTQGSAYVLIEKIGKDTEYGKVGANIAEAPKTATILQKQTRKLVRLCAFIAGILFLLVAIITYFNLTGHPFSQRIIESILSGITLAMAMIPEEFPVILTVFLSMGAWRLAKKHSLVRNLSSVETLGAISVLCVDKTGTITMNQMEVTDVWAADNNTEQLVEVMGLGCETNTYDPMEKAMLSYCEAMGITTQHLFGSDFITEYPFTNETKMMGHVWEHEDRIIIAAKGSPESILALCDLSEEKAKITGQKITAMSQKGLRVIAVAHAHLDSKDEVPVNMEDCRLSFCGLIGLMDPPRESVKKDIQLCIDAGIRVVMITGDNGITASAIARQVDIPNASGILTGAEIDTMSDPELGEMVKTINIFSRVIPEHKMRIVKALQANGETVAMTGDGVNDAPALKHSDIGIAMGKKGSEVSREAADLILLDDNFSTIVDTIYNGRRIYDNIRKAVGYVFAIHIPIALTSLIAPFLGIPTTALMLLPLHIVLLELVIDPTCSIVLERQPAEKDIMKRKPRNSKEKIIPFSSLMKSIIQGLAIFAFSFGTYYFIYNTTENISLARTMGLVILLFSNLLLVQVNASNSEYTYYSFMKFMKDKVFMIVNLMIVGGIFIIIYSPVANFLKLTSLSFMQMIYTIALSILSVLWYDFIKLYKKIKR